MEAEGAFSEGTIESLASEEQVDKLQEILIQDRHQMKDTHPDAGDLHSTS